MLSSDENSREELHIGIVGAAAAFRAHPVNVLRRVLDVTGFAVHTILGIDLKARVTIEHG